MATAREYQNQYRSTGRSSSYPTFPERTSPLISGSVFQGTRSRKAWPSQMYVMVSSRVIGIVWVVE